jgi:hypothetical protein
MVSYNKIIAHVNNSDLLLYMISHTYRFNCFILDCVTIITTTVVGKSIFEKLSHNNYIYNVCK